MHGLRGVGKTALTAAHASRIAASIAQPGGSRCPDVLPPSRGHPARRGGRRRSTRGVRRLCPARGLASCAETGAEIASAATTATPVKRCLIGLILCSPRFAKTKFDQARALQRVVQFPRARNFLPRTASTTLCPRTRRATRFVFIPSPTLVNSSRSRLGTLHMSSRSRASVQDLPFALTC
jgi:hypothetical protein